MNDFDQKWNRFLLVELPDLLNFFEKVPNQSFEWTSKFILISHQIIYEREGTNNLSWFEINPMHVRINSKYCISHFLGIFDKILRVTDRKWTKVKLNILMRLFFVKKHIIWKSMFTPFAQKSTENDYFRAKLEKRSKKGF